MSNDVKDRPTLAKMFLVALGHDTWTCEEQEWLEQHPKHLGFARDLAEVAERHGVASVFTRDNVRKMSISDAWSGFEEGLDEMVGFHQREMSKRQGSSKRSRE